MYKLSLISLLLLLCTQSLDAQNYNKKLIKQVKKNLGKDAKNYVFYSYPIDNYGVLTFYTGSPEVNNQLCSPFRCINMEQPAVGSPEWLTMYKFVSVGNGGTISLNKNEKKQVVVGTVLPKVFEAINLNAGVDASRVLNTDISLEGVHVRVMEPLDVQKVIDGLPDNDPRKINFIEKKLIYVYSDYVVDKMTASITVEDDMSTKIDASLSLDPATQTKLIASEGANINFSIKKTGKGTYSIAFTHPVILARSIKFQPTIGGLSNKDNSFITEGVPDPSIVKK